LNAANTIVGWWRRACRMIEHRLTSFHFKHSRFR